MNTHLATILEQCIGTKLVLAKPLNRGEYNSYRGWETPESENPDDAGYLIEYMDGGKPNHLDHAGYISWTPADIFEAHYRRTNGAMTFGDALLMLKAGKRVARTGWNGKGMFLALVKGADADYHVNSRIYGISSDGNSEKQLPILDAIYMKTATNELVPWLASQTDMLAEDWLVLDVVDNLATKDNQQVIKAIANATDADFVPECNETNFQVVDRMKCKNCGKSLNDEKKFQHGMLMDKCNLLREIISVSHNDHRSSDPNKALKEESAAKLQTLVKGF